MEIQISIGKARTTIGQLEDWTGIEIQQLAAIVGIIAVVIAWQTYRRTKRKDRRERMNAVFRDFLRMDFDFHVADGAGTLNAGRNEALRRLHSHKMWTLEEVWIWLRIEKRRLGWHPLPTIFRRRRIRAFIDNWHHTIAFHLHSETLPDGFKRFLEAGECYEADFVAHVIRTHPSSPAHDKGGCAYCAKAQTRLMVERLCDEKLLSRDHCQSVRSIL